MNRRYVVSKKAAETYALTYDNGTKKPGLFLNHVRQNPPSIKAMQMNGMRKVPITLAPVPRSKILSDEELE